jgi:hypothetical protein
LSVIDIEADPTINPFRMLVSCIGQNLSVRKFAKRRPA